MGLIEDLSATFVAFVIEADDAAEARIIHRTTRGGGQSGTWLVSLAMWRNCMQWVPAEGVTVAELEATARTPTDLHGMRRWGYVKVDGWQRAASGPPPREATVRPTARGARAQEVWEGVPAEVEARWAERLGEGVVEELRAALVALVGELDPGLPDTMPIVRHGWSTRRDDEPVRRPGPIPVAELGLDSLLARPLSAFALRFEARGKLSLALVANLLTVLGADPLPLRDLPDATGIARAQIDNAIGYLERAMLAEVVPTPGAKRGRSVVTDRRRAAGADRGHPQAPRPRGDLGGAPRPGPRAGRRRARSARGRRPARASSRHLARRGQAARPSPPLSPRHPPGRLSRRQLSV